MATSLWSRSVNHSPAGGYAFPGRVRPIRGPTTCRFSFKRPRLVKLRSQPSTSAVPLLLVPPKLLNNDQIKEKDPYIFYSPSERQIVTVEKNRISWRRDEIRDALWVGSSKGWVMFMNRSDCNLYLCNPLYPSSAPIIPLPPIETLPSVASRILRRRRSDPNEPEPTSQELDFEFAMEDLPDPKEPDPHSHFLKEIALEYWRDTTNPTIADYEEKAKKNWFDVTLLDPPKIVRPEDLIIDEFIHKMVLSCAPNNYNDCMVAIIYGFGNKLAVCRLGDRSWTRLDGVAYSEITFSRFDKSCLYTLNWQTGEIKSCRLSSPKSPEWELIYSLESDHLGTGYLAETEETGKLLVAHPFDDTEVMEVYELDTVNKSFSRVESLDGALFVGDFSETMYVPAATLPPQVAPNCVYFSDFDIFDAGVFSLEKRDSIIRYSYEEDPERARVSLWVSSYQVFEGLNLDPSSKENVDRSGDFESEQEKFWKEGGEGWAVWVAPNPW